MVNPDEDRDYGPLMEEHDATQADWMATEEDDT